MALMLSPDSSHVIEDDVPGCIGFTNGSVCVVRNNRGNRIRL